MTKPAVTRFHLPLALCAAICERARVRGERPADTAAALVAGALAEKQFGDTLRVLVSDELAPLRDDITHIEQRSTELLHHFDDLLAQIKGGSSAPTSQPKTDWREVVKAGNKAHGIETP